jgi:ERCC4-type nuclease
MLIDDREVSGIREELVNVEMYYFPQRLKTGDIVFDDVVIELKEINDFCASIIDGRMREQAERLKESKGYVIIYGRIQDRKTEIDERSVVGMMVSLLERYKLKILMFDNLRQVAWAIKRIYERHKEEKDIKLVNKLVNILEDENKTSN